MPDAAGHFKGITVPELPWHRPAKPLTAEQQRDVDLDRAGYEIPITPEEELAWNAKEDAHG